MIRQELVAKDLIQKGERNKTIVLMRKGVLQTFSPIHQKIKTRKTKRPDSTVTDLYFSQLRTSLNQSDISSIRMLLSSAERSMRVEGIGLKFRA